MSSDGEKSGRRVQSELFMKSIFKEMDALERKASSRKAKLQERTDTLLRTGCTAADCIDVLIYEGFDPSLVRRYVYAESAGELDDEDASLLACDD